MTEDQAFRSALPREERPRYAAVTGARRQFRSALPREERRPNVDEVLTKSCFDPRSRARSDSELSSIIASV